MCKVPIFNVISLEEPEECNAQGIKQAMENLLSKMNFTFQRKDKETGMCSDGASVNRACLQSFSGGIWRSLSSYALSFAQV